MPHEWLISRVCESFGCVPSVAERELELHPELVLDILEMRAFTETKQAIDSAVKRGKQDEVPTGPMAELVTEIEFELIQERNARLSAE